MRNWSCSPVAASLCEAPEGGHCGPKPTSPTRLRVAWVWQAGRRLQKTHRRGVTAQEFSRAHPTFPLELNFLESDRTFFCGDDQVSRVGAARVRYAGAKDFQLVITAGV